MEKREYLSPELEIFRFIPENGFAASTLDSITYDGAEDDGFEKL